MCSALNRSKPEEATAKKLTVRFEEPSLKKEEEQDHSDHDDTLPTDSNEETYDPLHSSDSDSSYHKEFILKKLVSTSLLRMDTVIPYTHTCLCF